jgi:hypothetical protein
MFTFNKSIFFTRRLLYPALVILVIALAFSNLVILPMLAAIGSINANDGQVDPNWGASFDTGTSNPGSPYELVNFYVNTDAAIPTRFYFRWETMGTINGSFDQVVALLDCNGNGGYADSSDLFVRYTPNNSPNVDLVEVYQGDWSANDAYFPNSIYGELVGNNIEVSPPVTGTVNWSACLASDPTIKAEVWDISFPPTKHDETSGKVYILNPTAPEIDVQGNGQSIPNGGTTPSTTNDTDFGSVSVGSTPITHTFTIRHHL